MKRLILICVLFCFIYPLMAQTDTLASALIVDDIRRHENRAQTGLINVVGEDMKYKAVMGTPDVIKTLQMLPGVAAGDEMSSGLYVRGGTGTDNLFLIDNVPLYQPSHLLGLFSVLNTDVIDKIGFYKGGFQAKHGGRISSVIDASIAEGNYEKPSSMLSIGNMDLRYHAEGPMKKDKSSYNIAIRQSCIGLYLPKLMNWLSIGDYYYENDIFSEGDYSFTDLNAKFSWKLSARDRLHLNVYGGYDYTTIRDVMQNSEYQDNSRWGNAVSSVEWERVVSDKTSFSLTGYVTDGYALNDETNIFEGDEEVKRSVRKSHNSSNVFDLGAVFNADTKIQHHHLRYGGTAVYHRYSPYTGREQYVVHLDGRREEKENTVVYNSMNAGEMALYVQDKISLTDWLTVDAGLRYGIFAVKNRLYNSFEPRLATSFNMTDDLLFKLSYSRMTQPLHLVTSSGKDSPCNFWMPSTSRMRPMEGDQVSAEIDYRPSLKWYVNLAGYYKRMNHLYQYVGRVTQSAPQDKWESFHHDGQGRSYGFEAFIERTTDVFSMSLGYTLSWSERRCEALYYFWYPDRFDNRHKVDFALTYHPSPLIDIYATWVFHSGNRYTLDTHYSVGSITEFPPPSGSNKNVQTSYDVNYVSQGASSPHNWHYPDYHRLNVGIDFNAVTRRGRDYTVSFSVYNLYNRMNPVRVSFENLGKMKVQLKYTSIFPILPSFRYTLYF